MDNHELSDVEISTWWGVATIGLIIGGGAIVVAKTIGPGAVETLINGSLMLIFVVGGLLLGLLSMQALGASQKWGLAEGLQEPVVASQPTRQGASLSDYAKQFGADLDTEFEDEYSIDPFYEVMKQNRSDNRAA